MSVYGLVLIAIKMLTAGMARLLKEQLAFNLFCSTLVVCLGMSEFDIRIT